MSPPCCWAVSQKKSLWFINNTVTINVATKIQVTNTRKKCNFMYSISYLFPHFFLFSNSSSQFLFVYLRFINIKRLFYLGQVKKNVFSEFKKNSSKAVTFCVLTQQKSWNNWKSFIKNHRDLEKQLSGWEFEKFK